MMGLTSVKPHHTFCGPHLRSKSIDPNTAVQEHYTNEPYLHCFARTNTNANSIMPLLQLPQFYHDCYWKMILLDLFHKCTHVTCSESHCTIVELD